MQEEDFKKDVKRILPLAAALRYDTEKDYAPVVVAIGKGIAAEKIVEAAKENDVPIVEDPSLARVLTALGINTEIPEELYALVAQVLIFVGDIDKKIKYIK